MATARLPTASNPRAGDETTLATIFAAPSGAFFSPTPTFVRGDVVQVDNTTGFSYSYDVLQIGDPFTITVPDPRGVYKEKLLPGWSVQLYMSNPAVNGGQPTLKVSGIITDRRSRVDHAAGTTLTVTGADLGWHLAHNDAPLWFNLRGTTLERLAEACVFPHEVFGPRETNPNWGFQKPVRASNEANRALKRGLAFTEAERLGFVAAAMANAVAWVQVQPGQKIADLLVMYARRAGLLFGVSADGHLQFFLPNYSQSPAYGVVLSSRDPSRNNVEAAERVDSLDGQYTHVTVVGEQPIFSVVQTGNVRDFKPQFGKFYGRAKPENWPPGIPALPFRRRATISDGEITQQPNRRAMWYQLRGLFDAQVMTYTVRGHHQDGLWWEADTMCEVEDDVQGISGSHYVSAVRCIRDQQGGDRTELTLRRPGLLTEIPLSAG